MHCWLFAVKMLFTRAAATVALVALQSVLATTSPFDLALSLNVDGGAAGDASDGIRVVVGANVSVHMKWPELKFERARWWMLLGGSWCRLAASPLCLCVATMQAWQFGVAGRSWLYEDDSVPPSLTASSFAIVVGGATPETTTVVANADYYYGSDWTAALGVHPGQDWESAVVAGG